MAGLLAALKENSLAIGTHYTAQVIIVCSGNLIYNSTLVCIHKIDTMRSAALFSEA